MILQHNRRALHPHVAANPAMPGEPTESAIDPLITGTHTDRKPTFPCISARPSGSKIRFCVLGKHDQSSVDGPVARSTEVQ